MTFIDHDLPLLSYNLHYLGQEAKKVFDDAQAMLKKIILNKSLKAQGVVGFYPASSVGDDIEVHDSNGEVTAVLHGLRQQVMQVTVFIELLCPRHKVGRGI